MAMVVIHTDDHAEVIPPELEAELREAYEKSPDDLWDLLDHITSDADPGYTVWLVDDSSRICLLDTK